MKTSIKILSIILITLLISCGNKTERKVYKTKDGKGYCYRDDDSMIWYLLYYNHLTGSYDVTQTTTPPSYDTSSTETMNISTSDSDNTSVEMSESTGESVGGSDVSNDSNGSGMSESSGGDSGSSDSGSSDSGGGGE